MMVDFDQIIDRAGTASVKLDARKAVFGTDDVIPLWVADMDFAAPEQVTKALISRAEHPLYGYSLYPDSMFESMQNWFQQRHGWSIARDTIVMCPGVVPSLHAVISALTELGDKVIVQPPVYFPFFSAVTATDRELVFNPLQLVDGVYRMDLAHLEQCAAAGAKLLLLCSPHNPVGRVWQRDELDALLAIARRYQLIIIADEIHADLIYPDQHHITLATISADVSIITAVSPSKTFNIAGLGLSALIVDNAEQRKAIQQVFDSWHISATNPFSICAFEAAYQHGADWLDALMIYLQQTKAEVKNYLEAHLPNIKLIPMEGTYLLWLDCRAMGLDDDALKRFFIEEAKVGMNPGLVFGQEGSGFMRLNIASPRSVIMRALHNIKKAST